jgi:hypothetical protein
LARFFSGCVQAKYRLVAPLTREGLGLAKLLSGLCCAFQLPSPLPRVNTARRHRSFLCRSAAWRMSKHSVNRPHVSPPGAPPSTIWAPSYGSLRSTCTNAWRAQQTPVESSQGCDQMQRIKKRKGAAMAARSESSAYLACFIGVQSRRGLTGGSTRTPTLARASVGALRASRSGAG